MDVELDIPAAIRSLSDTVDQLTGKKPVRVKRTRVVFVKAPSFTPEQIATIRKRYKWTQEDFASALNVPRATVASWETGRKKPSGASFRLLEIFQNEPKTIYRSIANDASPSRKRSGGIICVECKKRLPLVVRKKSPKSSVLGPKITEPSPAHDRVGVAGARSLRG